MVKYWDSVSCRHLPLPSPLKRKWIVNTYNRWDKDLFPININRSIQEGLLRAFGGGLVSHDIVYSIQYCLHILNRVHWRWATLWVKIKCNSWYMIAWVENKMSDKDTCEFWLKEPIIEISIGVFIHASIQRGHKSFSLHVPYIENQKKNSTNVNVFIWKIRYIEGT